MSDDLHVDGVEPMLIGADGRLADPQFLVNAEHGEVMGLVDAASWPAARLGAAVYRASSYLHHRAPAVQRRHLLMLDAAGYGDRELSARIANVPVQGDSGARWHVEWATGSRLDSRFRNALPRPGWVRAVATAMVDGRTLALGGSADATVRIWDLNTREQIGELAGHTRSIGAVATATVNGCPVAVTGSADATVRIWDLATGQQSGAPLTGHTDPVQAVATATVNGCPVAVTGSADATVRIWDLATGQ
ncbi:hypothetical protein AB0K02_30240, partial [Streptomyces sp. NPDC049597]